MQENINIPDSTITTNLSFRQLVLMNMQQLTNFPYIEKDFDALTDYELLCLVVKFLNDVIANQNEQNDSITRMYESFLALQTYVNNTKDTLEDAFNTLDDYVRNYFDNLDVQEEINNKLDKMLKDGVLDQIIEQFLQLTSLICFDNVADMKLSPNLANGSFAKTLGYYNVNDGGGAVYKITDTISNNDFQEELNNNLYATLIYSKVLNPKQLGAYGDNTHDDSQAFINMFNLLSKDSFYDSSILSNYNFTKVINIPKGTYLIKQSNLFQNMGNIPLFNTVINGNDSILQFADFTGDAFNNDNLLAGLTFNNIIFSSSNDSGERILFNSYSTGKAQNLKFNNCQFIGTWKNIFNLTGTNNNSEFLFNECYMKGEWESFLHDSYDTSSDQFLNYWFNNCRYWCSSTWIDISKGGHVKLNNCDISGYQPTQDTYLFKLNKGLASNGVTTFIDNGSRYELKTPHAKVLYYNWNDGQVIFDNVDFSSQQSNNQINDCFHFKISTQQDIIRFTNSKLYGKFYIEGSASARYYTTINIENCKIAKDINSIVDFSTQYQFRPALKLINSMFSNDNTNVYNSTLTGTDSFTNFTYTKKSICYNPNGVVSGTLHNYYKDYYIESISYGAKPRTRDNVNRLKVKCLLGTITELGTNTTFKVSSSDLIHFRKNMNVEINGRSNTISNYNIGTNLITIGTPDSSLAIDEEIYVILFDHTSNAYFGGEINTERMHIPLYNNLLFEGAEAVVGDIFFEIIE